MKGVVSRMKYKNNWVLFLGALCVLAAGAGAKGVPQSAVKSSEDTLPNTFYSQNYPESSDDSLSFSAREKLSENTKKTTENSAVSAAEIPRKAPSTVDEIVKLYTSAVNNVKSVKPGYTKKEYQSLSDLKLNGANSKWLDYAYDFVTDETESTPITVSKGSAQSSGYFPLYDRSEGCALRDYNAVKTARCTQNGTVYDIYIEMNAAENPNIKTSPLAQILTPVDPALIEKTLNENQASRFVMIDSYTLNYSGCYLKAAVDIRSGRLLSLTQVMRCSVSANGTVKAFRKKCAVSGTVVNTAEFYNFKY